MKKNYLLRGKKIVVPKILARENKLVQKYIGLREKKNYFPEAKYPSGPFRVGGCLKTYYSYGA